MSSVEPSLRRGLVGHWSMNSKDTSGGTLYDRSARNNHGETRSGITSSVAGRVGEAFSFDGTDGAYVPTQLFYDSTGITAVSVAHWFKSSSSADQITISSDRNEYWRLGVGSDGADGVLWTVDSSDMVSSASRSELQDGNWHHIVGTFDGSLTNDHAIYIDGQLDSKANLINSFGSGNKSYTHIGVGSEASVFDGSQGPDDHVVGKMDDVRVYNRAISASEARALFNMRSQRQHNSNTIFVESFENGSFDSKWDVSNATISSTRSFSGNFSFGSFGEGSVEADLVIQPNGYEKIDSFEYYWKEDNSQTGHVVILYDQNGNQVQESGTENPQWYLNDGSGGRVQISNSGTNYNVWTQFKFDFDWENGEYDYVLKKTDGTHSDTGTQPLDNSTGVSKIRFTGSGYGSADFNRFDNISVNI